MEGNNPKIVMLFGLCVIFATFTVISGINTKDKKQNGDKTDTMTEYEYRERKKANEHEEHVTKDEEKKYYDYSYGYCGYEYDSYGYCNYKPPGLYSHSNNGCFIQCDHFGNTFVRPCAYGTYWRGGRGPSYYNKCTW